MDQDGDGLLSREELMRVARLYGLEVEEKDVGLMLELGD
jgi:Ca2+-binding EF-hand superfamily protein